MMMTGKSRFAQGLAMALVLLALFCGLARGQGEAGERKKVLVVMSYHPGYEGEEEIARGLEAYLPEVEFRYFYLNTKYDYAGGARLAAEAFRIYQEYRPDAVVAVDDPAQEFLVVPYLRERVATPVVFCGVNFEAGKYRYPAANVTGVVEKKHYRESLGFAKLVAPGLRRVAVLYLDDPTNRQNLAQIEAEGAGYPLEIAGKYPVASLIELQGLLARLEKEVDGLLLLNLSGLVDARGKALDGSDVLTRVVESCRVPTIGSSSWEIKAGTLCGVIKSNTEQGSIAASLLQKIWAGTPVTELPLLQNRNGRRLVNLTTLKKLDLNLSPEVVLGTELLTTGQD
jgi:ABC-type uncharacterized transport system substrate-binding protein